VWIAAPQAARNDGKECKNSRKLGAIIKNSGLPRHFVSRNDRGNFDYRMPITKYELLRRYTPCNDRGIAMYVFRIPMVKCFIISFLQ
jgi:hypothetical protein